MGIKATRGHALKLEKRECLRDGRKFTSSHEQRLVGCWNDLDQHSIDAPVNAVEGRLDRIIHGWAFHQSIRLALRPLTPVKPKRREDKIHL